MQAGSRARVKLALGQHWLLAVARACKAECAGSWLGNARARTLR